LLQQNPPVLNWGCQLTQVVLHNGRETAAAVIGKNFAAKYLVIEKKIVNLLTLSSLYL